MVVRTSLYTRNSCFVGPRNTGSTFGYDRTPEHGPWMLRAPLLALHRRDVRISHRDTTQLDIGHRRLITRSAPSLHEP